VRLASKIGRRRQKFRHFHRGNSVIAPIAGELSSVSSVRPALQAATTQLLHHFQYRHGLVCQRLSSDLASVSRRRGRRNLDRHLPRHLPRKISTSRPLSTPPPALCRPASSRKTPERIEERYVCHCHRSRRGRAERATFPMTPFSVTPKRAFRLRSVRIDESRVAGHTRRNRVTARSAQNRRQGRRTRAGNGSLFLHS